jgi:integrase
VGADLIDLSKFMMATGERIGESLAVTWRDFNREIGEIDCSHQIHRIRGNGLVRRRVKSAAGVRIMVLPPWALEMLLARRTSGSSLVADLFGQQGRVP